MENNLSKNLIWEAYKYLSTHPVTDEELDIYYQLTYTYLEDEKTGSLDDLLFRATNEKITADYTDIIKCINNLRTKKEPS